MTRRIQVELIGDASSLDHSFKQAGRSARGFDRDLNRTFRGAIVGSGAFRKLGRSIAFASASFLGAAGFVQVLRTSSSAANDLSTQVEKTRKVFGSNATAALTWSKSTAAGLGLARAESLKTTATFGQMEIGLGRTRKEGEQMGVRLTKLTADLAAFNNAEPSAVFAALRQGILGQGRGLAQYGIIINATKIKQEALRLGLVKTTVDSAKARQAQQRLTIAYFTQTQAIKKHGANSVQAARATLQVEAAQRSLDKAVGGTAVKLTTAQKAAAAYSLIMRQSAVAHGAFAKSSGKLAEQEKKLKAELTDQEAVLGKALLPTELKLVKTVSDWLSKSGNQARLQKDISTAVRTTVSVVKTFLGVVRSVVGALGGWKQTAEILIALKVASWVSGWVGAIRNLIPVAKKAATVIKGLATAQEASALSNNAQQLTLFGNAADGAASKAARLRGILLGLARIGSIVLTVDLIVKQFGKNVGWDLSDQLAHGDMPVSAFGEFPRRKWKPGSNNAKSQADYNKGLSGQADANPFDPNAYKKGQADRAFAQAHSVGVGQGKPSTGAERAAAIQAKDDAAARKAAARAAARAKAAGLTAGTKIANAFDAAMQALDIALTKAQMTPQMSDDLVILNQQKSLLEKRLATTKNNLDLQQKLADVDSQINSIRQQAIDTARQEFGSLFQGPVLAPTREQGLARLGVPGTSAQRLTSDLKAQNALFAKFQGDLAKLAKRGAPAALIAELRAMGVAGEPEARALANASKKTLQEFFRQYAIREKKVIQAAKVELTANVVNIRTTHAPRTAKATHAPTPSGTHGGKVPQARHSAARSRGTSSGGGAAAVGYSAAPTMVTINLHGVDEQTQAKAVLRELQKLSGKTVAQTRGRYGGQNLTLS